MTRPCEVYTAADTRKRTITVPPKRQESAYVSLEDPDHCSLCTKVVQIHLSQNPKPVTTLTGRRK